jgi:hypothetical protein
MRVLVARHSPKNDCWASDGELLFLAIDRVQMALDLQVPFVGVRSGLPSAIGWVTQAPPDFSEADFLATASDKAEQPEVMSAAQQLMLKAASAHPIDTPMAAHYNPRGVPPVPTLVVHKVILYKSGG